MTKNIIIVSGIILSFFLALGYVFCAEEITITTYYPSPYGSYNKLTTNTLGIGDVDNDGALDDEDAPDPATQAGDLWLDGKINIGMNSPFNICVGGNACSAITSGGWNIFIGSNAGQDDTQGQANVFIGPAAGGNNTTGNYNTFIGMNAGINNTTASSNTFIGRYSGYYNTTGTLNTFLGESAGISNTTSNSNAFIGHYAGYANTSGSFNTFLGKDAGYTNTTSNFNTFIGASAGRLNTAAYNTFLGFNAGTSNTTGTYNVFLGVGAGVGNTSGSNNTFVGLDSGASVTVGSGNTFLGYNAGYFEAGSNKLYIANSNDTTPLIYGDFTANSVTINGSLSATTCGGCVSDKKFKKDINNIESPIEKILKMRGVSFNWNEKYKGRGFPEGRHFGLIAQEVKEVLPEVVSYNSYKENTIVYTEIIPVLIEAIKEQQREIEILKKKIERKKL